MIYYSFTIKKLDFMLEFAASSKIGPDFSKKVVLKLKLAKNVFLNSYSSMKTKSERFG